MGGGKKQPFYAILAHVGSFCPFFCIRGLSSNLLDGGASVKGHPKMLPVTASRHPDSEMMVVPGFPASHHHRLSLFLSLCVYQQVSKLVFVVGPQESNLYFCRQWWCAPIQLPTLVNVR